ncbi:MAG: hypothetical protein ACO3NK_19980, partial [Prochlorotrichaceae cyanobacterium]
MIPAEDKNQNPSQPTSFPGYYFSPLPLTTGEPESEGINFIEIIAILRRRWIICLAVFLAVVGITWLRAFLLTAIYEGSFELLIQS